MAKSGRKGKRFEREVAQWLIENDGEDETFATTSSGRLGPNTSLQFDVPSRHYACECKHRKSVPKWLMGAWEQVIEVADEHDKEPLLTIKKNYKPVMHCLTEERHAELLRKEREYDKIET